MANTSIKRFVQLVLRSGLLDNDDLRQLLADCKAAHGGKLPIDAQTFVDYLIATDTLTKWQTNKLLAGKYKGFRLGKYRLIDHIGSGGMSHVYLAEHTLIHQRRAIKVLPKRRVRDSSYKDRFYFEACATAAMDHPNIVRAFDIDYEGEDTHYIVMEYVEGRDIQKIVRKDGPLSFEMAANFTAQTAEGLQYAHETGLIHRDIKPANLLVDQFNIVRILDLGLALLAEHDGTSLTEEHRENVLGTADFLAPEQARNSHKIDHRVDIYGLGCSLYFMLTGQPPFPDGSLTERILQHQKDIPPDIRKLRPKCPVELIKICFKMLQKKPDRRHQSAREVADMLEAWLLGRGRVLEQRAADSSLKLAALLASDKVAEVLGEAPPERGSGIDRLPKPRRDGSSVLIRRRKKSNESYDDTVSEQKQETVKGLEPGLTPMEIDAEAPSDVQPIDDQRQTSANQQPDDKQRSTDQPQGPRLRQTAESNIAEQDLSATAAKRSDSFDKQTLATTMAGQKQVATQESKVGEAKQPPTISRSFVGLAVGISLLLGAGIALLIVWLAGFFGDSA